MNFRGLDIYTGRLAEIETRDGQIESYSDLGSVDNTGYPYLSHGMIDMQVNGYRGIDYSGIDLNQEGIEEMCSYFRKAGTFRHVPTIITNSEERIIRNVRIIAEACASSDLIRESIAGIHIEGPFISSEDGPRGAHDKKYVRIPDVDEFNRWQEAAAGLIKIVTIAPEARNAIEFTAKVAKTNVHVAIGHCAPSPTEIDALINSGADLSTHLGNGSHAVLPRLRNYIWEELARDELAAGVIADGYHVPAAVLKCFARVKGINRIILVSDTAPVGGLEPGPYKWGDIDVEVCNDGHVALAGTSLLAGAGALLDHDVSVFMNATDISLEEVLRTVTVNPAKVLGVEEVDKPFRIGDKADILCFDNTPEQLRVKSFCFGNIEGEV